MQEIAIGGTEIVNDRGHAVDGLDFLKQVARGVGGFALLRNLDLLLHRFLMFQQRLNLLFQFMHRRIHLARERLDERNFVGGFAIGFEAGNGFNAPHTGGNGVLAHDAEQADLARRARVRAAAKFHRIAVQLAPLAADLQHADGVAVFLAEKLHDVVALFHFGVRNFKPRDRRVFEDAFVDEFLDIGDLLRRERRAVEIEGQFVRADERAFLRSFLAHDFMQRPVQQMRDRMVALDGVAAGSINLKNNFITNCGKILRLVTKCSQVLPDFCVFVTRSSGRESAPTDEVSRLTSAATEERISPVSPTWPPISA